MINHCYKSSKGNKIENSKIEQLIREKEFSYLQPYFYNNRYALRCELGVGEGDQYMINAKNRAMEIFNILFADGIDAIIFNYWIFGIVKVDINEAANRARHLVHKSARLSEEYVFGILRHLCNFHVVNATLVIEIVKNVTNHYLKSGRGRKTRALEYV